MLTGLREGATENSAVAKVLFRDLLERGLDPDRARLFVVDGPKALQAAIRKVFGPLGIVQRCQIHKRRNLLEHLPEHRYAQVDRILREAWESSDADLAKRRLQNLASSLESEHPSAAESIREGLEQTVTLQQLGIGGSLYRTLQSTNTDREPQPLDRGLHAEREALAEGGSMILRWASAAVLDASKRFRRIRGYRDLARLTAALESIEQEHRNATDQQVV